VYYVYKTKVHMHIAALIITTAYMYYQEHSFFPLYKCSRQFCRFV